MTKAYSDVISFEELYKALKKSCNNVRWKDSVNLYEWNGMKNTYKLLKDLENDKYKIQGYQHFKIYEPKERDIVATRIRDRQFQRSLCDNILSPEITKSFIRDNCACQQGKGVDDALNRLKKHMRWFYQKHGVNGWVLKCDIKHYFAETDHSIAKQTIRNLISDDEAYKRVAQIIDSFDGDKGIGLGSQVSQIIQLTVLNNFDHWVKEKLRVKCYVRYMDDFILIHENKEFLMDMLRRIKEELAKIGLELNAKTTLHPLKQGVVFLRWRFVITDSGRVILKMNRNSILREARKLKAIANKIIAGVCTEQDLSNSFESWKANAQRGNTRRVVIKMEKLYNDLLAEVRTYGNYCSNNKKNRRN